MSVADYSVQPYTGTDIIALILALSALLCLLIRMRDHEPGMGWFFVSLGSLAVWNAFNESHLPDGPELNASWWYLLACLSQVSMCMGLIAFLGVPARLRWPVAALVLTFPVLFVGVVIWVKLTGAFVLRTGLLGLFAMGFVAMALMVFWAARRRNMPGDTWIGFALLVVPISAIVMGLLAIDPVVVRYLTSLLCVFIGITLPAVSLARRRHELRTEAARRRTAESRLADLNHSLEEKIAQRTGDLQQMVTGLESFNRSVSHDLHGPLSGISSLASLADSALRNGDTDKALFALPLIADEATSLRALVSSLLDLARVTDSKLDTQPVDVAKMAQEIVDQLRLSSPRPLPRIILHSLPGLTTDPGLLRAILTNLIGNAAKFTPGDAQGYVEIGGTSLHGEFNFYVRDNGAGFDADKADLLFEPFYRQNAAGVEGYGIGLSIVGRAVERLGGRVWAESQPGQGSVFSVSLPEAA